MFECLADQIVGIPDFGRQIMYNMQRRDRFNAVPSWSPKFAFRYGAFKGLADEIVEMMKAAISAGLTNHAASMAGVEQQCRDHLGEPRQQSIKALKRDCPHFFLNLKIDSAESADT